MIPGNSELGVYQYWPVRGHGLKVVGSYILKPRQWVDVVVGVTAYGRGGYTPGAAVHYSTPAGGEDVHLHIPGYVYRSTVAMQLVVAGVSRCRI